MNLFKKRIFAITRSKNYTCDNASSDLNYPSFITFYNKSAATIMDKQFKIVTNVGDGSATYNVKVIAPKTSVVGVAGEIGVQ